ncbi:MAG: MTAP family purine nucleoside phosphorylase [Deltaproteobacteria bacterium]|nr:MTAP family purine nucleoside phosphorylase [Deltaproteobacteria bacterium]
MGMLGIITGTIGASADLLANAKGKVIKNAYGKAFVLISPRGAVIPRHGSDRRRHILPHEINHPANMTALKDLGVDEVIAVNSTGSLRKSLKPGLFVVPDDFILPYGGPTVFSGEAVHITPTIDASVRLKLVRAAGECRIKTIDGGIYWQTKGPRLETKAEIAMMARFAHLVGMTMAGEAIVAQELDLPYACLCSVDNYAHGIGEKTLSQDQIVVHARQNSENAMRIIRRYIENHHS